MSEFGFQSLPPLETVQTYADKKDWNMTSYIMEHHERSAGGNGLMISQMTDTFQMPASFSSLVYLSMVLQAEGIRYGVLIKQGKQFVTGQRVKYRASTFEVAQPVRILEKSGKSILVAGAVSPEHDSLIGVPQI